MYRYTLFLFDYNIMVEFGFKKGYKFFIKTQNYANTISTSHSDSIYSFSINWNSYNLSLFISTLSLPNEINAVNCWMHFVRDFTFRSYTKGLSLQSNAIKDLCSLILHQLVVGWIGKAHGLTSDIKARS